MGDAFVGIVSPSKIYNILAVGAPVLYIGPVHSHVTELLGTMDPAPGFYSAEHSDVNKVISHILAAKERAFSRPDIGYNDKIRGDAMLPLMMAIVTGEQHQSIQTNQVASVPVRRFRSRVPLI